MTKIKMSEGLINELDQLEQSLNHQIQQFVDQMQKQRIQFIGSLIKGYLADKEYPKDADIKIEDGYIVFLDEEESESE